MSTWENGTLSISTRYFLTSTPDQYGYDQASFKTHGTHLCTAQKTESPQNSKRPPTPIWWVFLKYSALPTPWHCLRSTWVNEQMNDPEKNISSRAGLENLERREKQEAIAFQKFHSNPLDTKKQLWRSIQNLFSKLSSEIKTVYWGHFSSRHFWQAYDIDRNSREKPPYGARQKSESRNAAVDELWHPKWLCRL